ncbi:MAG TPA: hypothetical protein VFG30_18670 [Polyangiales bacterium]|nr:hypothetical protein [Polyangiales bacterium]
MTQQNAFGWRSRTRVMVAVIVLPVLALLVFVMPVAAQADAEHTRGQPASAADDLASSQKWRQQVGDYEQAPAAIPQHRSEPRHWYGWQTVGLDVLWLSSLSLAGVFDVPGLAWGSLGIGLLGVPLIHLAYSNYASAGISVGLRLGAYILIGAGVALVATDASDDAYDDSSADGALGWVLVGLGAAGLLTTVVVDAKVAFVSRASETTAAALTPWFTLRGAAGLQVTTKL